MRERGCAYHVTGMVTSSIEGGSFEFTVEGDSGHLPAGTVLTVKQDSATERAYGMKGLQWGMDGVVIGFSTLPEDDVLVAQLIIGNDDTSSRYWENFEAA